MNINRHNYESWFIDYFDGALDAVKSAELFLFLEQHPDLREEFESFSGQPLEIPLETFAPKASLRRDHVNSDNVGRYLIASLEGDLSEREVKELDDFLLQHPQYKRDQQLFSLTRIPATSEVFPDKKGLKQPLPLFGSGSAVVKYAAAAVITLLILSGSYLLVTQLNDRPHTQTAQQHTPVSGQQQPAVAAETNPDHTVTAPQSSEEQQWFTEQPSGSSFAMNNGQPGSKKTPSGTVPSDQEQFQPAPTPDPIHTEVPVTMAQEPIVQQQQEAAPTPVTAEQPVAMHTGTASAAQQPAMTVWDAVKQKAGEEIGKVAGTTEQNQLAALDGGQKPKVKLMRIIGKGIEKVSGDKVRLTTSYDVDGEVMAYNFEAGGIAIEKK